MSHDSSFWKSWLAIVISFSAAAFTCWQAYDAHELKGLLMRPSVDFYTEDDSNEPIVGIQIMNGGPGPAIIKKLTYFVDRKMVRDYNEASDFGKFTGDFLRYFEFDDGDTLAVNEKHWLFYRTTKNKKELDRFNDFLDRNLGEYYT